MAYAFTVALVAFGPEINALEANVNAKEASAVASAATATTQAGIATSQANLATLVANTSLNTYYQLADMINAIPASGSSTSSVAISLGQKTFVIAQSGRNWVPGMLLLVRYDNSNYMWANVISYTSGTNTLVVDPVTLVGSGTYASWSISWRTPNITSTGQQATVANNGNSAGPYQRYHLDSSGGAFSLLMNSAPVADAWVEFVDVGGQLAANPVTLQRNGKLFFGLAEDLILDVSYMAIRLVFDPNKGWVQQA